MPNNEESALIREAQQGRADSFGELVSRYDAKVLRLALGLVRSKEEARDIYQEAFLRAYDSIRGFRFECAFGTWLFRIVTNICLDHLRRRGSRPEASGVLGGPDEQRDRILGMPDDRPEQNPERALLSREMHERIDTALGTLSPRERLVFEMRHYEGMRLAAIGEVLETSEETVKNCLFRAHRTLRDALSDLRSAWRPVPQRPTGSVRADIYRG